MFLGSILGSFYDHFFGLDHVLSILPAFDSYLYFVLTSDISLIFILVSLYGGSLYSFCRVVDIASIGSSPGPSVIIFLTACDCYEVEVTIEVLRWPNGQSGRFNTNDLTSAVVDIA